MKNRDESPKSTTPSTDTGKDLRLRAEKKVARLQEKLDVTSPEEIQKALHELQVHQIELEMQNEELSRAQVELDTSRARYFDLYDLAPVGYFTLSEKGLIMEANLTAATLLNMPRNMLTGRPISGFILKEDQDIYYLLRKRLFETGKPQLCEMRMLKKDGTIFWGHLNATIAKGADGAPECRVVMSDVTERMRSEQLLKESEERNRAILRTSMDGIFFTDMKGRLLDVNAAYCRMSGYSRQELLALSISDLSANESSVDVKSKIAMIAREGSASFEALHRRRDGSFFDVEASVTYLPIEEGRIVSFMRDITNRKRAEEALKATLERLRRVTGSVIQVVVAAVESRDPYTAGHQRRVGDLARSIAFEMGITPGEADGIRIAGIIHDLGKISVPAEILSKPRQLSDTEFALVKEHPRRGYEILKGVDFDWPIAEMIHQHHERIDGSGYPRGLKGEDIIQGARILAVADVVEAMASHRPYRPTMGIDAALEEISSKRGVLYDPEVVDACLRLFTEKNYRLVEA